MTTPEGIRPPVFDLFETGHRPYHTDVQALYLHLDAQPDQFSRAVLIKKTIPQLLDNPVGVVNYLVYANIAENPHVHYDEGIVETQYMRTVREKNHGDANAIARIMMANRNKIVDSREEPTEQRELHQTRWAERERTSLIAFTKDFLEESEESHPEDYNLRISKLYNNIWEHEKLGGPDGFPIDLAREVTYRIIEHYIDVDQPQYAFEEAAQTGLAAIDPRVIDLFGNNELADSWREYHEHQEHLAQIREKKRRIGSTTL